MSDNDGKKPAPTLEPVRLRIGIAGDMLELPDGILFGLGDQILVLSPEDAKNIADGIHDAIRLYDTCFERASKARRWGPTTSPMN